MTTVSPGPTGATTCDPSHIDWNEVLERHERWLRSIVYARLGEPQAVDDVMQEVAMAAVRQAAPIRDLERVGPWLYRLAVRQSLLYRRKMGRRRNLTRRFAEKFQPTENDNRSPGPLGWLLADERRAIVRAAIQKLRPSDAQILMLKYSENWNYHQIADNLGVSHSAVEARLHRARARLRRELISLDVTSQI